MQVCGWRSSKNENDIQRACVETCMKEQLMLLHNPEVK